MPPSSKKPRVPGEEDPLVRIAARRMAGRIRRDAATPEFGRLLAIQALSAAGDSLFALALAGSLFFSVPETTARGRVSLYLLLTMAPFAVAAPFLARVLDRNRATLRWALVAAAAGRGILAWLLATRLESFFLFPIAFGVLVLSRATLVVRGAVLPQLVPEGRSLVAANASLTRVAAISGIVAGLPGLALLQWPGVGTELLFAAGVYFVGLIPALGLPLGPRRLRKQDQMGARASARSVSLRQAIVALAGMRFLVGFLTFHLAFALRREDFGSVGLGVLIGSAALGGLGGALAAPRLRRRLKEEGILVSSLAAAGISGVAAGFSFSLVAAGLLIFVYGVASGAAKVAFDSIVQRDTPEGARGWAFARSESTLQLAWVAGALAPLVVAIPSGPGVVAAGVLANLLGILYVAGRHRVRAGALP